MDVNRVLRMIAGVFIMLSVALGVYHNANWFFFTGFIGLNLFQSSFTNKCPMMLILKKTGFNN